MLIFLPSIHIITSPPITLFLLHTFSLLSQSYKQHSSSYKHFFVSMLIWNPEMKIWFSKLQNSTFRCKECAFSWLSTELCCFETGLIFSLMKRTAMSLLTCILALGGATVGTISGAIKGQTTETGLFRGAGVGAVAGAITAVQLMELMVNGEPFSKVALICSLVNGKIFMEWVSPAVLKAYQWQISNMETNLREISDIFEVNAIRGLSHEAINNLPTYDFLSNQETTCAICLMEFKNGDSARMLPTCRHSFHVNCIDEWLHRHGSCPLCRSDA